MDDLMGPRKFLQVSMTSGAALGAGMATKGKAMAQEKAKITQVDKVRVWVLTDNYYDSLRPDTKITKRYRVVPGKSIHAEHGLSYYVESVVDGKTTACMFDYGLDPVGVMNNVELLGLDLGKANAFSLSHGHFDHWMGAVSILKQNQSRIPAGTPFYVGEEAFARRYSLRPGTKEAAEIGQLNKGDIEALGLKVVEVKPDDFRGEQAIFFDVKGKGLVVLSGCAHAGIVNTAKHAQKISGSDKIHAVMGGFHLINAKPEVIQQTVADIKAMKPDYIIPTHCTGFEAISTFAREMPAQFNLNTAGTRYTFGA
jgi:7,8-dihydropterin-6-yl-methyl-4-(beta-D-ribofuranosyl)aminobenzene 5'-phosphate synthase